MKVPFPPSRFKQEKRIISLDVLRGFAVLGILIMNIQSFSMPPAAYINPSAYGDLTGINRWVWILSHLLASEKFMSLFSMLFGAGVLLFTEKARTKGANPVLLHYRRMGGLLLFGLLHGYLLWSGDILVSYSLCGMLVFLFRHRKPEQLLGMSLVFFLIPMILYTLSALSLPYWPEEQIQQNLSSWKPGPEEIRTQLLTFRGGWLQQMEQRIGSALFMQTGLFFIQTFWRVMAMMLLGMALFKWKLLSAQAPAAVYRRILLWGTVIGLLLSGSGVVLNFRQNWSMEFSMFGGALFNYAGSVALALAYMALIMLICQAGRGSLLIKYLAPAGRMAFTNYILMTLTGTFIFYGHGLGLYGKLERWEQALIVPVIWIFLLLFSFLWMRMFRFGPMEALWRSLTYGSWQSLSGTSLRHRSSTLAN